MLDHNIELYKDSLLCFHTWDVCYHKFSFSTILVTSLFLCCILFFIVIIKIIYIIINIIIIVLFINYLQFKSLATVLLLPIKRSNSNQKFTYPPGLCDPDYTRGNGKSKFLIIPFIRILVVNFDQGEKSAIRREQDNTTS